MSLERRNLLYYLLRERRADMPEMRTIEIDFDIHKLIEGERRSFAEAPNTVLRRLLKLEPSKDSQATAPIANGERGAWTGKGVRLPSGTELRMEYRGKEHRGVIRNSAWLVEGKSFKSPSAAAGGVAETKDGTNPSLDGWKYWQVKRPGDPVWIALGALRQMAGNE
jgi:hypothetical protein